MNILNLLNIDTKIILILYFLLFWVLDLDSLTNPNPFITEDFCTQKSENHTSLV